MTSLAVHYSAGAMMLLTRADTKEGEGWGWTVKECVCLLSQKSNRGGKQHNTEQKDKKLK